MEKGNLTDAELERINKKIRVQCDLKQQAFDDGLPKTAVMIQKVIDSLEAWKTK